MRKRLKRSRGIDGVQLTPAECRRRSREALERRVLGAVFVGDGLTVIARRPHMPRYATLKRWIVRDAAFRDRYRHALRGSRYVIADDMRMEVDALVANARTERQRATALRMRLNLIKWWTKTFGGKSELEEADDPAREFEERVAAVRRREEAEARARAAMPGSETGEPSGHA